MEKEETEDFGKDHGNDSQILQQNKEQLKNDDSSQKESLDGTNSSEESFEITKKEASYIMVNPEGSSTTANYSPPKTPVKKSLLKRNNVYSDKKSKEAIKKQNEEMNVETGNNKESGNLENNDRDKIKESGNTDISKYIESKGEKNVVKEPIITESISKELTKQIEKISPVECHLKESDSVSSKENYNNPEKEIIEQNKEKNVDGNCDKQSSNLENQKIGKTKELGNDIESNLDSSKDIENENKEIAIEEQTTSDNISKEQTKESVKKIPIEYDLKEGHCPSSKMIDDNTKKEIMK